ncbi:MAG: 30S ribosome-binding factor RbfA [Acidobacteriota bacterium]
MSQRQKRLADLIRQALSEIFQRGLKDPRVRLVTISNLEVTRDLSHAQIRVSVLGSDEERQQCLEGLQRAKGYLRSQLASRVSLRTVPELHFELDRGAEHSEHIHALLEQLDVGPEDDAS